jgi:Fur family ferric uptake transcriptional regulator
MLEDAAIQQVELPGEAPRYERAGMGHHHHFRCNGCNRVFDWFGCDCLCEEKRPQGFDVQGHDVFLYGRCVECVGAKAAV